MKTLRRSIKKAEVGGEPLPPAFQAFERAGIILRRAATNQILMEQLNSNPDFAVEFRRQRLLGKGVVENSKGINLVFSAEFSTSATKFVPGLLAAEP